jgi:hypothetical protein
MWVIDVEKVFLKYKNKKTIINGDPHLSSMQEGSKYDRKRGNRKKIPQQPCKNNEITIKRI